MALSRLVLLRAPFFRIYRNTPPRSSVSTLIPLRSLLFSTRPHFKTAPPRLQFHTDGPAAAAEVNGPMESAEVVSHPWPEWVTFIEQLKRKGYFNAEGDEGGVVSIDESGVYSNAATSTDLNRIKTACMNFARERFDILRSLTKKDIQAVVECGCPNLYRKAVNSAKRLRAYVKLDEGDVCSACNLRGSCDRAYVITKEDEGPRTVDVVRILLSYATDPLVHSEGEKPQSRENVEVSARKLLSELIELSDTSPDPSLPKPAVKTPSQKEQSQKDLDNDKGYQNVEMKRGDWICSKCNFMNFSRNVRCLKCKEDGPKRVSFDEVEMKKGDWTCPECQFMNFARNLKCIRCQESRPKRQLNPGEWECPSCDFLNYRRNMVCLKCNCKRPKDEVTQYEDQTWRKPKEALKVRPVGFGDDNERSSNEFPDAMSPGQRDDRYAVSKMKTSSRNYP